MVIAHFLFLHIKLKRRCHRSDGSGLVLLHSTRVGGGVCCPYINPPYLPNPPSSCLYTINNEGAEMETKRDCIERLRESNKKEFTERERRKEKRIGEYGESFCSYPPVTLRLTFSSSSPTTRPVKGFLLTKRTKAILLRLLSNGLSRSLPSLN